MKTKPKISGYILRSAVWAALLFLSIVALTSAFSLSNRSPKWTSAPDAADGSWMPTGSLGTTREVFTATLLPNGKVLVAGGFNGVDLSSAEVYDPGSGTWNATGSLNTARRDHTATLLLNGKVLVAGGGGDFNARPGELYDPASGSWTPTGSLGVGRRVHTATLLPNGMVLVAGGYDGFNYLTSAELYDPASGNWSATGSLNTARSGHTATLLPNGKVLVAGGNTGGGVDLSSAEVYDPGSGTWNATGSLNTAREIHTATLLPNGKVLVAGGFTFADGYLSSAEVYDPADGSWVTTASLNAARYYHTATLLPDGEVLVPGGYVGGNGYLSSAELYDPASGTWNATGSLNTARFGHTATLLPNAKVLVVAGQGSIFSLSSAELYPGEPTPTPKALENISTRLSVGTGENVLIGGFIITGNAPKKVLLRAIGPSLADFGLTDLLADPVLELHKPDGAVVTNENWKDTQEAEIEATKIAPKNDLESAVLVTLDAVDPAVSGSGAYTVIVKGNNGGTGVALVEAYDLDEAADSQMANISTRGFMQGGDNVIIGGVIIGKVSDVLLRAIGPELTQFGVSNPLEDTILELHDKDGVMIASNDDWRESQQAEIEATGIAPKDDRESAILRTLQPSEYTAIVSGKYDTTGVALFEAYQLSQ